MKQSVSNGTLQNGMYGKLQNGKALRNVMCFKMVHYHTVQLQNGTLTQNSTLLKKHNYTVLSIVTDHI